MLFSNKIGDERLEDYMMNRKKVVRLSIKIMIVIIMVIVFILINESIVQNRQSEFEFIRTNNEFVYQVDDVYTDDEYFYIKGWFFELENVLNKSRDIHENQNLGIVLYNINEERETFIDGTDKPLSGLLMSVSHNVRNDINEYFNCGYDYSDCGFVAKVNKSKIDLENGTYHLILKYDKDIAKSAVNTDIYIHKGRVEYFDPSNGGLLNVEGTDLEKVINDGYCLANMPNQHIYLYQYGKKLYWIADRDYCFESDGGTPIQLYLYTTQYDKLPQNRIDSGFYWDSIGDNFEAHELTETYDFGDYRVSVRDIPDDYAITWMVTGYYDEEKWIWQKYFIPIHLYNQAGAVR